MGLFWLSSEAEMISTVHGCLEDARIGVHRIAYIQFCHFVRNRRFYGWIFCTSLNVEGHAGRICFDVQVALIKKIIYFFNFMNKFMPFFFLNDNNSDQICKVFYLSPFPHALWYSSRCLVVFFPISASSNLKKTQILEAICSFLFGFFCK